METVLATATEGVIGKPHHLTSSPKTVSLPHLDPPIARAWRPLCANCGRKNGQEVDPLTPPPLSGQR